MQTDCIPNLFGFQDLGLRKVIAGFDGGIAKPVDQDVFPELVSLILSGEPVWHIV